MLSQVQRARRLLQANDERLYRIDKRLPGGAGEKVVRYRADPAALMLDAGLTPDPWQVDMLHSDARRILALCSRQVGKSTTSILALHTALCQPRATITVVAPAAEGQRARDRPHRRRPRR